ncbi:hypothetical protein BVRB_7g180740 [Beta vulgaris subsp. vulgaris]|uniref:Uncharacterized protein n=1 Tax=Beta vulgaris subsp. vulgaris TaxID=3555 RepID=A0A0J8B7A4_BETVV|nr:hypothetical protein BVRB_7g180740 [Beta vulgaris subsp. vulgaris]
MFTLWVDSEIGTGCYLLPNIRKQNCSKERESVWNGDKNMLVGWK